LGHHHRDLGTRAVEAGEGDALPVADAVDPGGDALDVLRVVVLAVEDDEVLGAAADVELALGEVAEVPGLEPAAAEGLLRRLVFTEVTGGDAGPAEPHLADLPLAEPLPARADDRDLVPGEGPAAGDELHGGAAVRGPGLSGAHRREVDAIALEAGGDV